MSATTADLARARQEDVALAALVHMLDHLGVSPTLPEPVVREFLASIGITVRKRLLVLVTHARTVRALEQEERAE